MTFELDADADELPEFGELPIEQRTMLAVHPMEVGRRAAEGREFPPPEPLPPGTTPEGRYFPETGYSVRGAFWTFYENLLGPWRLGAAISPEMVEDIGGISMTVQYFERGRLEWHPEYQVVQFAPLGRWAWEQRCQAQ
ncbi:MAG: hypothetical protein HC837_09685 [Chloroflexaceae bacterium]|nr:hypothetical protein [Chloroflexaceae bacterium]